jgi:hypothetical protein
MNQKPLKMRALQYKIDQLQLFVFLWAVASVIHVVSFIKVLYSNPFAWLTVLTALFVLLRPKKQWLFLLMLIFSICKTFIWMPNVPNHLFFELIINIGILVIFLMKLFPSYYYKNHLLKPNSDQLYNAFAPMARVSLIILYLYTVFHKLNTDFLNPELSCGPYLLKGFRSHGLSFIPDTLFVQQLSIYGTFIVELAIPILLLFRSTQRWGILLGLAFHYLLSLHPFSGLYSFSALLFSLYILFTPKKFPTVLVRIINCLRGATDVGNKRFVYLMTTFSILSFLSIMSIIKSDHPIKFAILCVWSAYALVLVVIYLIFLIKYDSREKWGSLSFNIRNTWLIPVIIFLNGLSPYIGLKTETSFSMFSNLRTEGGVSNHLLVPANFHLTNWQKDLVLIKASDLKALQETVSSNVYLPFLEFKRKVSRTASKDFFVLYTRNGVDALLEVKNGVSNDLSLTNRESLLFTKFVHFRPVEKIGCSCKH